MEFGYTPIIEMSWRISSTFGSRFAILLINLLITVRECEYFSVLLLARCLFMDFQFGANVYCLGILLGALLGVYGSVMKLSVKVRGECFMLNN